MTPILPLTDRRVLAADAARSLVDLGDGPDDAFFSVAQRTLRSLLGSAGLLEPLAHAEPGAFSRRLLFSDPMSRFGIWVIDWPAGCRTPVHNHHCSCAYGVYLGSIEEITYSIEPAGDTAVESARRQRNAGYVGGSPLGSGLVHEMLNSSADPAVSIHIYAYRPDHHADSIDRCFTAARTSRRPDVR
jgi:predicted metal-dependent enzyme (double-stranded beta helix superfamily)